MKTMKCIFVAMAFLIGAAVLFQGCVPVEGWALPGSLIKFKATSGQGKTLKTKTVYSGKTFTVDEVSKERIDWTEGDKIRVWSDKATYQNNASLKYADYRVVGVTSEDNISIATINPDGIGGPDYGSGNGLVWGEGTHCFYSLYPSTSVNSNGEFSLDEKKYTLFLPSTQTYTVNAAGDTLKPNMDYAYMYAAVKTGVEEEVNLDHKPMFTALQFTVNSMHDAELVLKSFKLTPQSGTDLTGYYDATVSFDGSGNPTVVYGAPEMGDPGETAFAHVTLNFGDGITVTPTHSITFTVFIRPVTVDGLTATFETTVGSKSLELKDSEGWIKFKAGWKYNIKLMSIPGALDYIFSEIPDQIVLTYEGGIAEIHEAFKSYRERRATSRKEPVAYTVQYKEDDGEWQDEAPAWLSDAPTSANGSIEGITLTPTVKAQYNSADDPSHAAMVNASGGGADAASATDLSLKNVATGAAVSRTTANCYVVSAPGYYKFPLVYGNGVVNGEINTLAFHQETVTGAPYLTSFQDHLNSDITTPYIASKYTSGLTAEVLWTDAIDLVTDAIVTGSGQNAYITFLVPADRICQGNALIALKVNGEIAWSWHIWITNENLVGVTGPRGFKFSPQTVGWVDGKTENYSARQCTIKFVQDKSGYEREVVVLQNKKVITTLGNNPYYQWGRKDPLHASTGNSNAFKKYYGTGASIQVVADGQASLGKAIQTPYSFYGGVGYGLDWCSSTYYNLWNSATIDIDEEAPAAIKTIYDPSPTGYMVPRRSNFGDKVGTEFHTAFGSLTPLSESSTKPKGCVGDGLYFYFNGQLGNKLGAFPDISGPDGVNGPAQSFWTIMPSGISTDHGQESRNAVDVNFRNNGGSIHAGSSAASRDHALPIRPVVEDRMMWFGINTGGQANGGSYGPDDYNNGWRSH